MESFDRGIKPDGKINTGNLEKLYDYGNIKNYKYGNITNSYMYNTKESSKRYMLMQFLFSTRNMKIEISDHRVKGRVIRQ